MRPRILLIAAAAAMALALALAGCPGPRKPLAFKLEQPVDLPRPPSPDAPGLTSDLVPPGVSLP